MTQYLVTKDKLDALAVSVSDKSGEELPLTIDEMREAVNGIETGGTPNLQAKTNINPSTSSQTIQADSGYDGLSSVQINAVPIAGVGDDGTSSEFYTQSNARKWRVRSWAEYATAGFVGPYDAHESSFGAWGTYNAVPANTTITPSTSPQTIGGANYMMEGAVTVAAMPSGSVSASATKGSVSNHAISVTPTATVGTAGYIAAGSTNGTAVSVSASELVSGTYTVDSSGTKDVTNYASASIAAGSATASATKGSVSNHAISVTPSVTRTAGWVTAGSANGTAVTVTAAELASGNKEITANGTGIDVVGYSTVSVDVSGGGGSDVQVDYWDVGDIPSATSTISFTELKGEPTSFIVYYNADLSTPSGTPYKIAALVYDGTDIHGQTITNTSNAQVTYDGSSFSKSYSNGTLTLSSTGAYFQPGDYCIAYTYGGTSGNIKTSDVQVGSGATSITFTGLEDEPIWWSCIFKSNFSTSSGYQRVIFVTDNDGRVGMAMDSSAHNITSWTASYSNGSFTITSQGTNAGGYFHQPGYYQLTYAIAGDGGNYQSKTVTPTTSQQVVQADSGYDALKKVTVEAMPSMTLPTAASGTSSGTSKATITPTSSAQYLNIPTGYNGTASYYTIAAASGGSASVASTTWSNSSNTETSHQFTGLSGTPKAAFLRCTSSLSRSSSSTNYFIADMVWNGTSCVGNSFRRSNGTYANVTSGYTVTTGSNSITFTSSGTSTTNPGSFYNGTYELVYVY